MRVKATSMWCGARWLVATPAPQVECRRSTDFDQYFCNGSGGATTGGQSYILQSCGPRRQRLRLAKCDTYCDSYGDRHSYTNRHATATATATPRDRNGYSHA